nr:PqqD family protein [Motilibacter deserti]
MLLHPASTSALSLNESATSIWAACTAGAATVDEVVEMLHDALGVDADAIRADVEAAVQRLLHEGYLLATP